MPFDGEVLRAPVLLELRMSKEKDQVYAHPRGEHRQENRYLVLKAVCRAINRNKSDVKGPFDALLGSRSLIYIAMSILEHEKVLKTFELFDKSQI